MILLDLKRFRSRVGCLRVRTQVIETLQVLETLIMNLTGLQTPLHAPNRATRRSSYDILGAKRKP